MSKQQIKAMVEACRSMSPRCPSAVLPCAAPPHPSPLDTSPGRLRWDVGGAAPPHCPPEVGALPQASYPQMSRSKDTPTFPGAGQARLLEHHRFKALISLGFFWGGVIFLFLVIVGIIGVGEGTWDEYRLDREEGRRQTQHREAA